ncbi:serine/threonine-protein kinase [Pseudanabaena sp. UWO310]|uniref:serine/threonine-protein kinase n=1 Tax=Pseudanabaena sp. UWO310 TaxID=2480795 RepID=UPI001160D27F|nr:serine/threonine-protein kinase [Pseudanabaena sp. UWO310]TYQ25248.1 serine/threonine protein kinase [Pseudanabaena sp. UWO310]
MNICSYLPLTRHPSVYPLISDNHFPLNSYNLLRDRYRILDLLGEGGFGRTFLAVDELQSPLLCVVKQLLPNHSIHRQKIQTLFDQEAQRLAQLEGHTQIPKLLDHFEQDGESFIVQEWIDGWTLQQEIAGAIPFHEIEVRKVLQGMLPVLQYLHDRQIVHRDIKPDNIIRRKCDQQLVLVDFGAAKQLVNIRPIYTGTMIGSVEYAAPEQIKGQAIFASDLYSLGVTCLYLLTQTSPFDLYDIVENDWKWQAYLPQPISLDLKSILNKLLQPSVRQRYQSATEVLTDLNASSASSMIDGQVKKDIPTNLISSASNIENSDRSKTTPNKSTSKSNFSVSSPLLSDDTADQDTPLFADDLASIKSLPLVQRVLIVGIGASFGSVAIASLSFCLSIIILTLSAPRSSDIDSARNNQIILAIAAGITGLAGLAALDLAGSAVVANRGRATLKKNDDYQKRVKDEDEENYFG